VSPPRPRAGHNSPDTQTPGVTEDDRTTKSTRRGKSTRTGWQGAWPDPPSARDNRPAGRDTVHGGYGLKAQLLADTAATSLASQPMQLVQAQDVDRSPMCGAKLINSRHQLPLADPHPTINCAPSRPEPQTRDHKPLRRDARNNLRDRGQR
jgi:hypothetical protein